MSLVSNPAYRAKTPFKDTKSVSEYKSCNSHFTQLVPQIMSLWTVWTLWHFRIWKKPPIVWKLFWSISAIWRLNSNVGKVRAAIWRFLHNFSQNLHFSFQRLEFMVSARQMESNHSTNLKHYYLFTLIKQITQYLHHICSQIMFH